jgi:hypothetical protein
LGIALDEQKKNDGIMTVEGFKVVFDPDLEDSVKYSTLDYRESAFFGSGFVVVGSRGC